jgi:hypothetical protein
MASAFTTTEFRPPLTFGRRVLSAVRCDYVDGSPSEFYVLVFDEDEGYVANEAFLSEEEAVVRLHEMRRAFLGEL